MLRERSVAIRVLTLVHLAPLPVLLISSEVTPLPRLVDDDRVCGSSAMLPTI